MRKEDPYFVSLDEHVPYVPEKKLLCAVLERAKYDLAPWVHTELRLETVAWFEDTVDDPSYFTFSYIKEEFSLSAKYLKILSELINTAKNINIEVLTVDEKNKLFKRKRWRRVSA